jgi:hypothetical protein
MSTSVITASSFNAKNLTVSELKKLDNGSGQVYLNYGGGRLRVQSPQMSVPYDSGDYNGNQKYKVNMSFKGAAQNPKLAKFQEMLQAVDNYVIDTAVANAGKWFKMPGASRELVAAFFTPSIKVSKDKDGNPKDYPPTVVPKLAQRNGAFDAELYDDKNVMMEGVTPLDVLRRGAEIVAILDVSSIWVGDKKFGVTWKLHQACVKVPGEGGSARGFLGVDEDTVVSARDEADLMAAVMPSKAAAVEDEDEEEDEEEVVPAPPVPAKKVVRAVKKAGAK